jgi:hypothetical protein
MSALLLLAISLTACAASSPYMKEADAPSAVTVDAAAATVVFIRPAGDEAGVHHVILDEKGRFLGISRSEAYFGVKVAPGEHTFMSYVDGNTFGNGADRRSGTPALKATLEAGKLYYVHVVAVPGSYTTRARLIGLGPSRSGWNELPGWLAKSTPLVPDEAQGQAHVRETLDVNVVVQKGLRTIAEYDSATLAERSLTPSDGVSAPVAAR